MYSNKSQKNLKQIKKMNKDKISLIRKYTTDLFNFSDLLKVVIFLILKEDVYKLQQKER